MEIIRPIYKPIGLTPLEAINELKRNSPNLRGIPLTYAGRLDPVAEGVVLVLGGEAIDRKEEFLSLPKTYEAEILFGLSSDTFDLLGMVSNYQDSRFDISDLKNATTKLLGKHTYPYPIYSSQPVNGKPLWQWAREGKINKIALPTRTMDVYSAQVIDLESRKWSEIYRHLKDAIGKVKGDFRQPEILTQWAETDKSLAPETNMLVAKINFIVASGTYIRTLAHTLGQLLDNKAILLKLNRTAIGPYLANQTDAC